MGDRFGSTRLTGLSWALGFPTSLARMTDELGIGALSMERKWEWGRMEEGGEKNGANEAAEPEAAASVRGSP